MFPTQSRRMHHGVSAWGGGLWELWAYFPCLSGGAEMPVKLLWSYLGESPVRSFAKSANGDLGRELWAFSDPPPLVIALLPRSGWGGSAQENFMSGSLCVMFFWFMPIHSGCIASFVAVGTWFGCLINFHLKLPVISLKPSSGLSASFWWLIFVWLAFGMSKWKMGV